MRYYETLYLINPNLADEDYREVVTKFSSLIESNKGQIIKVDEWGKKALAYAVENFDKGYYVLLRYCGDPDILTTLKRDLKLDDRILKYQTIKLEDDVDLDALLKEAKTSQEAVTEETTEPDTETSQESENDIQE